MHTKFERLLSKSLTTLEVMTHYLVEHTGPGSHRLVGLVVKASASRAGGPGFESR